MDDAARLVEAFFVEVEEPASKFIGEPVGLERPHFFAVLASMIATPQFPQMLHFLNARGKRPLLVAYMVDPNTAVTSRPLFITFETRKKDEWLMHNRPIEGHLLDAFKELGHIPH